MLRTSILAATLAVLMILVVAPAQAQQAAPPPQQQEDLPDIEVDDQELRTVAEAYLDVQNVTVMYRERFNQEEDPAKARELQQEFTQVANEAIQDHGLSIERYDTVIKVANVDDELRERLLAQIEELMNEESAPSDSDS